MNRRDAIIALVALGTAARPLPARAQPSQRLRQIAVLMGYAENDPGA